MDHREKSFRIAATVVVMAVTLWLMGYLVQPIQKFFSRPEAMSLVIYLETGRVVKPTLSQVSPPATEETRPPAQTEPPKSSISFTEEDAQLVQVSNFSSLGIDVPALLMTDLEWDLTAAEPKVLIIHSHATESYTQTAQFSYQPSADYRTLDTGYNVVRVGQSLKEALEAKGIGVIHDTELYDYPSYSDAYIQSREAVRLWLARYPSICLVIDLHRDASGEGQKQLSTSTVVDNRETAQIMLVVGSNAGGRLHPNWKDNFALAAKLHAQLERRFPGICRPISFRTERFNQDLSPGALLIEIGAAGDTLENALAAADFLAEGISDLALGAVTVSSTN